MGALYDEIGRGYAERRQPDPRIERALRSELDGMETVVNVGAGAGSYEPRDRSVVAVEISRTMIEQRPQAAPSVVQASADRLPFADAAFDAALAILTVHHWTEQERGIAELGRVARRRVVALTWDPSAAGFWLADYFPDLHEVDRHLFPPLAVFRRAVGPAEWRPLPIPHDCTDGFLGAYWRRPHAYLDPDVRSAISTFSRFDAEAGLARLRHDLADGSWRRRYGALLERDALDLGYGLVVARPAGGTA